MLRSGSSMASFLASLFGQAKAALGAAGGGKADGSAQLDAPPLEAKQAKLEDSNIAGIGSKENRALRKAAAGTDPQFKGAGQVVGLEVWRVENRRSKSDTPEFGVKRWPVEDYGKFYGGDSYIVLNTYRRKDPLTGKEAEALSWDLHFWLGSESSQDEKGVAAYKTVELDDLLDDGPVQYRECQFYESRLFQSYFKEVVYMQGGLASGFRSVRAEEYQPRLFMVRSFNKTTRAMQIPLAAKNLNQGDVFVLDAGAKVYRFIGASATQFETNRSGLLQSNIVSARHGKAAKANIDADFWKLLGGSERDVRAADAKDVFLPDEARGIDDADSKAFDVDQSKARLFRISDAGGKLAFKVQGQGATCKYSMLDTNDVFLLATPAAVWLWVGNRASSVEKRGCIKLADKFLEQEKLARTTPVVVITEDRASHNHLFVSMFTI